MARATATRRGDTTVTLACFEVKGQTCAIAVEYVREIVRVPEVTPLPDAPALIEGVIDLRGAMIPVLDLARVLGRGHSEDGLRARIVVLATDDLVMGLRVDAATDVLALEASAVEDVPQLAARTGYDAVRSIVRREGAAPVMVLAPEALIQNVERSSSPPRGFEDRGERR
jgi:purine-binding chemotaxis protein CheW